MSKLHDAYGTMIRIGRSGVDSVEVLKRIPLDAPTSRGNVVEATLQDLLFRNPRTLPIKAIDETYDGLIPVCRELSTQAGPMDALFVNRLGRMTLVEFKLWRNPQARREVIGQILDYAKELASWSYEDLQREISKASRKPGNVLHELVHAKHPDTDESAFVDNVTRHLQRGEFLLLIVGDGIREGVENIVDFVQRNSGLHFNLALVEAALYRDTDDRLIVQPRIIARTEIVRRFVYETGEVADSPPNDLEGRDELPDYQRENLRYWTAVLDGYSFSDVTVEVPKVSKESNLVVHVGGPETGRWDLYFSGYLNRSSPQGIGCYLTRKKDNPIAAHIYGQIEGTLEELRTEAGSDLDSWTNKDGLPRFGFHSDKNLPFKLSEDSAGFQESVRWMRQKLDMLVSTVHPRLRQMLRSGR